MILVRHGRSLATRLRTPLNIIAAAGTRPGGRNEPRQQECEKGSCHQWKLTTLALEPHSESFPIRAGTQTEIVF